VEAEGNDLAEGAVKDELEDFILGLPSPAVRKIADLSSKVGGLKPSNTNLSTQIKLILLQSNAKLILGIKSRKPSMEESIKAILYWFDSMMGEAGVL
jgi:hypothetical protein